MPTLYLGNTATASPFPTTSKQLVTSAPASEVQLGPGEFDSGLPGNTDAGQWNPSSPIVDTTAAAELDNTGASLGTTRQGWLYDVDLSGKTLRAGTWTVQLRLRANQGTGTTGMVLMRATIVTGSSGSWVTVANLCTTSITGETSHSTGQTGWRTQNEAALTVTSTAANFSVTFTSATEHTFSSGERLLLEFGFGNANNTTDRTWRLDYNTSNSFATTPAIVTAITGTIASTAVATGTARANWKLNGTYAGLGTVDGVLARRPGLAGTIAALATIPTAELTVSASTTALDGIIAATGALTGTLGLRKAFSGTINSAAGLVADFEITHRLVATMVVLATLSGTAGLRQTHTGTIAALATLVGALRQGHRFTGTITAGSFFTGNLTTQNPNAPTVERLPLGVFSRSVSGRRRPRVGL